MKTKDLDNLTQGDIVVFIKPINGWAFNKFKIGDQYKFHSFNINKNMPMSSNTVYLESLQFVTKWSEEDEKYADWNEVTFWIPIFDPV